MSTISPPGRWTVREGAERTAKIRIISDNGNKRLLYTAHAYSEMGLRSGFFVHISSEEAENDLISGDVYRKTCLAGQFFVHMSSVQRDAGYRQCTTEVRNASGVQRGGRVFGGVSLNSL